MVCHGELARLKPGPRYLTEFYLLIAAGGALGGLLVAVVAPLLFSTYLEWPIGMVLSAVAGAGAARYDRRAWRWRMLRFGCSCRLPSPRCVCSRPLRVRHLARGGPARNFFGVIAVMEYPVDDSGSMRISAAERPHHPRLPVLPIPRERHWATSYYGEDSGVGQAIELSSAVWARCASARSAWALARWPPTPGRATCFASTRSIRKCSAWRGSTFTYLGDCRGTCDVVLGRCPAVARTPNRHSISTSWCSTPSAATPFPPTC